MKRTRQLAAIMFTDIEGYTSLMQQNEGNAIRAREKHRSIFNSVTGKFNGRILQYFGDGTLSIFSSAIDAVLCGIEMQQNFLEDPSIPVRIGIHLGDIIFSDDEIIGDGVNVASRIESLAVAGSVFISDKIFDEIKNQNSIQTVSLDSFRLKNVEKPVEIYAISNSGLVIPKPEDIKDNNLSESYSPPGNETKPDAASFFLLTKLHIPSADANLVHRAELFKKLDSGLGAKLILVSAPAGYGKSTLLIDWINQNKISAAWISIDNNDNEADVFLSYIIAGIQRIQKDFGANTLRLLNSSNKPSVESLASLILNEIIQIDHSFLLVLDDFHLIENDTVLKLVSYFLDSSPSNMHFVISTRSDPTLPLARLRSRQQLVELRAPELGFSENDIYKLFNKILRLELSGDDINRLKMKTEGWIAGLQLAGLSLQECNDKSSFINDFAGNNRYIMDYLIEEVLSAQSESVKEFLLKTSVLEQLSAPLCNSVLKINDSQEILDNLDRNNMFVYPLDEKRFWYRYHHLFSDLLKQRLLHKDKSEIEKLHNSACDWFNKNGMFDFAIQHALEINNYEKSLRLIEENVGEMWKSGRHDAIIKYGNIIPDVLIKKSADFCLYYSWILITNGQIEKAEIYLSEAEKIATGNLEHSNSTEKEIQYSKKLLGKVAVAFAYAESFRMEGDKIFTYCKIALENLTEDDFLWHSWAWFSYGIAYFSNGNISESIKAYEKALYYGKESGNIYLISTIGIRLAENQLLQGHYKKGYDICADILELAQNKGLKNLTTTDWKYGGMFAIMSYVNLQWGEVEEAYKHSAMAYRLSKGITDIILKSSILINYSCVSHFFGNIIEAEEILNELTDILNQNTVSPYISSTYVIWNVYRLIDLKKYDEASQIIHKQGLSSNVNDINFANEAMYMAFVRLLLSQNNPGKAEPILAKLFEQGKQRNNIEMLIELYILSSVLFDLKGDNKKALSEMIKAMELASGENLISYFVNNVENITGILKEVFKVQATSKSNIPDEFVNKMKVALQKKEERNKTHTKTDLSSRELDTLKLLAENLTNQEIAEKLFISLNTVKTHLKNINLKLEVDNRNKAIAKAKKLGLV